MKSYDIVVVGAGASGMTAAISAARLGARVCLLEAKQRVGKKLLATGNGRCNLSNSSAQTKFFSEHYRCDDPKKLRRLFDLCPFERVAEFLESIGIEMRNEDGRLYPRSEKAASVLDMLRFELERLGVDIFCENEAEKIAHSNKGFSVLTAGGSVCGKRLILACGSPAAPELSGTESGIRILRSLGIGAENFKPSLAPIPVNSPYLKQLKGVRAHCEAQLICKGKILHTEQGELQFAEGKLSGIMIFQLSARLAHMGGEKALIRIDLMPEFSQDELIAKLNERAKSLGHLKNEAFLSALLPKPLALVTLKRAGIEAMDTVSQALDEKGCAALAKCIKRFDFTPLSASGYAQAQTAAGGARLSELDCDLRSLKNRDIFLCGELINCDGDCGGFNLHFAWLSGIIAGEAAARSVVTGA